MRKWEIYKSVTTSFNGIRRLTSKDTKACTTLHKRRESRTEAYRIVNEMKRQGIVCCVRQRAK